MEKEKEKEKVEIKVETKENKKEVQEKTSKKEAKVKVKISKTESKNDEITKEKQKDVKDKKHIEETALAAQEKIETEKILPEEVKKIILNKVIKNIVIGAALMLLVCIFHLGCLNIDRKEFIVDIKFFSIISLIATIIIFEKAYKKDNGELAIHGIEGLVFSIYVLFLPYIYFSPNKMIQLIFVIAPIYFGIYYAIKSIIIEKRITKAHYKSLSDVKEIIKKERKK